jgi:hypothetical protein
MLKMKKVLLTLLTVLATSAVDAIIAAKMGEMVQNGWKLIHITSGVESDAGKDDGNGIFITRMYWTK